MKIEGPATKQKVDLLQAHVAKSHLIPGVALCIGAVAYYFFFLEVETEGGSHRVNAIALAVYELMGLVYGTILFGVIGGGLLSYGIYNWLRIKDFAKQIPQEQEA